MNTEHTTIDNRPKRKVVEYLTTPSPDVCAAVLALAFVVETVDLGYLPRLVVPPDKGHALGVPYFESEQ